VAGVNKQEEKDEAKDERRANNNQKSAITIIEQDQRARSSSTIIEHDQRARSTRTSNENEQRSPSNDLRATSTINEKGNRQCPRPHFSWSCQNGTRSQNDEPAGKLLTRGLTFFQDQGRSPPAI
jgi:hypothetical protein